MNPEQRAVILAMASIVAGIAALVSEAYRIYILVLYPLAVILYLMSSYINKIDKNEEKIMEMNKKIEIHERLARLEGRVFK
jgi:uncharacterized ion transporter superfamily protein YfcC